MCTVLAKESQSRVIVLTGVRCCLSVEQVEPYIPKVSRENGWFELYNGEICIDIPTWATWLPGNDRDKATQNIPDTYNGKRVWYFNVSDRVPAEFQS